MPSSQNNEAPDILGTLLVIAEEPRKSATVALGESSAEPSASDFPAHHAHRVAETVVGGRAYAAGAVAMREELRRRLPGGKTRFGDGASRPAPELTASAAKELLTEVGEDIEALREWLGVGAVTVEKPHPYALYTVSVLPLAGCDPRGELEDTVDIVRAGDDGFLAVLTSRGGAKNAGNAENGENGENGENAKGAVSLTVIPCDPAEFCDGLEAALVGGRGVWTAETRDAWRRTFRARGDGKDVSEDESPFEPGIDLDAPFWAMTAIACQDLSEEDLKVKVKQLIDGINEINAEENGLATSK